MCSRLHVLQYTEPMAVSKIAENPSVFPFDGRPSIFENSNRYLEKNYQKNWSH